MDDFSVINLWRLRASQTVTNKQFMWSFWPPQNSVTKLFVTVLGCHYFVFCCYCFFFLVGTFDCHRWSFFLVHVVLSTRKHSPINLLQKWKKSLLISREKRVVRKLRDFNYVLLSIKMGVEVDGRELWFKVLVKNIVGWTTWYLGDPNEILVVGRI